jgi:hypothetical protein
MTFLLSFCCGTRKLRSRVPNLFFTERVFFAQARELQIITNHCPHRDKVLNLFCLMIFKPIRTRFLGPICGFLEEVKGPVGAFLCARRENVPLSYVPNNAKVIYFVVLGG